MSRPDGERQIAWHGRSHSHGDGLYELHYFISGEGSFRNGSFVFSIEPVSLYITPPVLVHQISATNSRKPITYYALLFSPERDAEVLGLLNGLGRRRNAYASNTSGSPTKASAGPAFSTRPSPGRGANTWYSWTATPCRIRSSSPTTGGSAAGAHSSKAIVRWSKSRLRPGLASMGSSRIAAAPFGNGSMVD